MNWTIDPSHSSVSFSVKHLGISTVRGTFHEVEGAGEIDEHDLTASRGKARISVASIDTRDQRRDAHLRSADFFDAETYPTIDFAIRSVARTGAESYRLVGDLTIRDVTREVSVDVEGGVVITDPWGNTRIGFSAEGEIDRTQFGLRWNQVVEAGRLVVGEKVKFSVEAELVKEAAAVAAA